MVATFIIFAVTGVGSPMNVRIIRIVIAALMFAAWMQNEAALWIAEQTIPSTYDASASVFFSACLTLTFFIACLYVAIGPQRTGNGR